MPERRPEDVGLRDLAQQRPAHPHRGMHQVGVGVEQPPERGDVCGADGVKRRGGDRGSGEAASPQGTAGSSSSAWAVSGGVP